MFQKPSDISSNYHQPEIKSHTNDDVETVVGPSVVVEGDFASEGNIVVKGVVSGSVKTSKLLSVENGASIFANVRAGSAIISGNIKGNVKINERLELTETAQILGDIECKVLSVSPGALVQGKVNMRSLSIKDDRKTETKKSFGRLKTKEDVVAEE